MVGDAKAAGHLDVKDRGMRRGGEKGEKKGGKGMATGLARWTIAVIASKSVGGLTARFALASTGPYAGLAEGGHDSSEDARWRGGGKLRVS